MPTRLDLGGLRVFVTGGAGFLGSAVVRKLREYGAEVIVFDNLSSGKVEYVEGLGVTLVRGDVRDRKALRSAMKDSEIVIHLAALPFIPDSFYHPLDFFEVNVIGTINVFLEAMFSETVERFVHISSSEVYGTAKYVPMNEEHPTNPHSTYAVSKLAADRAVFTLYKERGFPVVIVRPFNCYGPNVTQPYIIPEIILQLLSRNDGVIQLGNVETSRDFTYVDDIAEGIVLASISKQAIGEVINLGSGREIKIRELAHLIGRLMGRKVKIEHDPRRLRPFDVDRLVCDWSKANKLLGWAPRVPLEEGLKRTIRWFEKNPVYFKTPFEGWPKYYRMMRKRLPGGGS